METYSIGLLCQSVIIGAVVQGEFYERRFGGGPPHLDMSLAVPQGVRRGVLSIVAILLFAWSIDSSQSWGIKLLTGMAMLWAIFGVYRTVVQARAPTIHRFSVRWSPESPFE